MSKHNWKPGDVATWRTPQRAVVVAVRDRRGMWHGVDERGEWYTERPWDSQSLRPLVVIDAEDREQVARLADAFCTARWSHIAGSDECDPLTRTSMETALREFANFAEDEPEELPDGLVISEGGDLLSWRGENYTRQKVSPPTPPKPEEEPTLPAAIVQDSEGVRWVSYREAGLEDHKRPWASLALDDDRCLDYADITAPKVVFEGVTE